MAIDFTDKNVRNTHIDLKYSGTPWFAQLGATVSSNNYEFGTDIKSSSLVMYYDAINHIDKLKNIKCLRIKSGGLMLHFNDYDLTNNDVYLKFYKIRDWSKKRSVKRLVYTNQDQMLKLDDNGNVTLPAGEYGINGWEILQINKNTTNKNYFYRVASSPYINPHITLLDNKLSPFVTAQIKKINQTTPASQSLTSKIYNYAIPYFNIQNHPIAASGFAEKAIFKDEKDTTFQTSIDINPFCSTNTHAWNFCEHPILLYSGDVLINNATNFTIKKTDDKLFLNGVEYPNFKSGDRIVLYIRKGGEYTQIKSIPYKDVERAGRGYPNPEDFNGILDYEYHNQIPGDSEHYYFYSIAGTFSSSGSVTYDMDILEMSNGEITFNTKTYPNQYVTQITKENNKYNLYNSIITYKNFDKSFIFKQSSDDETVHYNRNDSLGSDLYRTVSVVDNIKYLYDGDKSNAPSAWSGEYKMELSFKNYPYIKTDNYSMQFDYSTIEAYFNSNQIVVNMLGKINSSNSTVGIFKSETLYGYYKNTTGNNTKIGFDAATDGDTYAIWVVLWRF